MNLKRAARNPQRRPEREYDATPLVLLDTVMDGYVRWPPHDPQETGSMTQPGRASGACSRCA